MKLIKVFNQSNIDADLYDINHIFDNKSLKSRFRYNNGTWVAYDMWQLLMQRAIELHPDWNWQ